MKINFKLTTVLFVSIAFLAISCDQTKQVDEREDEATHHEGHNDDDSDHAHDGTMHDKNENEDISKVYAFLNVEQASNLLDAYLELKDALVNSSADAAHDAAQEIKNILAGNTDSKVLSGMLEDADHIAKTDEMERIRKHFDKMSQNVYKMVKVKRTGKTVYKQFCPMAFDNQGAFWLSSKEEIRNPYFGDKMLKCGKVEETLTSN